MCVNGETYDHYIMKLFEQKQQSFHDGHFLYRRSYRFSLSIKRIRARTLQKSNVFDTFSYELALLFWIES